MPGRPPARRRASPALTPGTSRRRRALGQHFLSNTRAARRIIECVSPCKDDLVLEVGPGKGVLTSLLLDTGVSLIAVERDPGLAERLRECRVLYEGAFRTNPDDPRSFALSDHIPVMASFAAGAP